MTPEQTADSFEVSPQQEQLWLSEPGGPSGRVQALISVDGSLDEAALRAALTRSIARHEILRTTFAQAPGMRVPLQAVAETLAPAFSTVDLSGRDEAGLDELSDQELAAPIDLAAGPTMRALLVNLGDERHAILLTLPSLCADASSATLLARELAAELGAEQQLIEDPLQYADFSAWQRELQAADDEDATAAKKFWATLEHAVSPEVPFTNAGWSAGAVPGRIAIDLGEDVAAKLIDEAARYGASPASLAQAAWHAVLARSTGEDEITVTSLASQRRHGDLDGAVGAFARPVPVTAATSPERTFPELLQQVDHAAGEALVWQDYVPHNAPSIRIGFVAGDAFCAGGISLDRVTLSRPGFGLWLTCLAGERELTLTLNYDPDFTDRENAERIAHRLVRLLESIAAGTAARLGELEVLPEAERTQLLETFNDSGKARTSPPVHEQFAAHAAKAAARDAVIDEHGSLSYAELDARANQLANRLRRAGVGPDVTVGLCTDRSIDMVVGLLGILKAGGAYVPLHYEHPPARLGHQLTSSGAVAIVTQEAVLSHLPEFSGEVICLDRDRAQLDAQDRAAPEVDLTPENLVYVIFTSGSTGTPKGVAVTHGNLANYASAITAQLEATEQPLTFGVVTSISTDLGNTSVFGALCSGGTLALVSPTAAADAGAFTRQLAENPIDVLKITPSHLGALIAGGDAAVLPRRWLVIGGERAPWDLVARVKALCGCRILNHYGPTEATVGATAFEAGDGPGQYQPATVPIGRPLAGDTTYVLDEHRRPVALGAPGRLHIGGAGVARGYIGAPDITAERFVEDPFRSARMYDTGDLARWLPDGTLEFLGRADEQIKIRGYRVEPAEVEAALRNHAAVTEAVVVARTSAAGDMRLIAYCTVDPRPSQDELKAHLGQWLPEFMLPAAIVTMDALPMTPSGKVDRLALPDPDEGTGSAGEYVEPRTPVEQAIAEIWAEVLGVGQVGVEDDFFALGGHSLLATQVVARVRSDFAVELPLHSLFTYPTVASLTAEIVQMMGASEEEETARLMAELEGLSDEEAERLLAAEPQPPDAG